MTQFPGETLRPQFTTIDYSAFIQPHEGPVSLTDYIFPQAPSRATWMPFLLSMIFKTEAQHQHMALHLAFIHKVAGFDYEVSMDNFLAARHDQRDKGQPYLGEGELAFMRDMFTRVKTHRERIKRGMPDDELMMSGMLGLFLPVKDHGLHARTLVRGLATTNDFNRYYYRLIQSERNELE